MKNRVVEAKWLGGHRLFVRFDDGSQGEADLAERLRFDGVFEPLADPAEFGKVEVDGEAGCVCWPTEADLDPDVLHSWVTGVPLPDFTRGRAA